MKILGIDPGISGGLFFIENDIPSFWCIMPTIKIPSGFAKVKGRLKYDKNGKKIEKFRTEVDAKSLVMTLRKMPPDYVFVERVHAHPGQGVTSCFSFGQSLGILKGAIASIDEVKAFELVGPKVWQKVMFEGMKVSDTKEVAAAVILELWPDLDLKKSKRSKKPHDGICDAACIAEYGRRQLAEGLEG